MVRPARAEPALRVGLGLLVACAVVGCAVVGCAVVGCAAPAPVRLASGAEHVCAVTPGEVPRCWGSGRWGQLAGAGADHVTDFPPALDVAAGGFASCAVDLEGAVWCAGFNDHGQLGDGTLTARDEPRVVLGLPPMVEVSLGYAHACARTAEGEVWCWGWSSIGQAAPGARAQDVEPARVEGLPAIASLSLGLTHSCAIDPRGDAYCWGELTNGEVAPIGTEVRAVAVGVDHVCVAEPGRVVCRGAEPGGGRPPLPAEGRAFPFDATVAAGAIDHACFGGPTGAWCIGKGTSGQLGGGRIDGIEADPIRVVDLGAVQALAVGERHSCAVSGGRVFCWGWNDEGQLGDSSGAHSLIPQPVR